MITVALIGCGKIGSRHLQSIIKLNFETKIYLVDPKKESINICLNLIENDLNKSQKENIKIYSEINEIPSDIDFAIVATDSKPRFNILKYLLNEKMPKYLILEKLLFTKENEFAEALKLIKKADLKVWVNQWMSTEPSFRNLCSYIQISEPIEVLVKGDNWGLCCNSVHYLELFDFLCNEEKLNIKGHEFEKVFFSKRQGYLEINGRIDINSQNGSRLTLISNDAGILEGEEISIIIKTSNVIAECFFRMDSLVCRLEINGKKINKHYNLILQSDFTHRIIEEIHKTGSCNLPSLERAIYHHNLFYPLFKNFFKEKGIDLSEGIPIT
tara:strand:+ start:320 stop:1300 length:981 start_codon:yes stop_codon:yes gene_type:complete